ncbi:HAD family phosphatase [Saccharopolyspora erythraea]|uniref:HAD family hydrolase n=1 Tax=Saccharopolyspora erythraea TaxID=1836 RepID=UPI001BAB6489|nr:HAD family phosphatase [Saccharopolyspora erythraea]QUH00579.1 HAD family phosphatase [Saccharopolyspora erythraea]
MGSNDIRAVIFDYGGVLTTSGRAAIAAWTRAERIRPETYSAALKEWLSRSAPPGTPIHRLETGEIDAEEFNRILAARLRTEDDLPVSPDGLLGRLFGHMSHDDAMLGLVRELRDSGVRTALLSNSWGNNYPWELLDELFEVSVISGQTGMRKPQPEIYRLTLDRLGLSPATAVFVDDGRPNVDAAAELGMHTVLHVDAERTRGELTELLPALQPDHAQESR